MTRDFTRELREASKRRASWSLERGRKLVQAISSSIAGAEVDWDEDSGEEWARILLGDRVVAMVRVRIPLAIVLNELSIPASMRREVVFISVGSLDATSMRADPESVASAFPERVVSPTLDLNEFSAFDLWFATS